jgi:hypothetical protein
MTTGPSSDTPKPDDYFLVSILPHNLVYAANKRRRDQMTETQGISPVLIRDEDPKSPPYQYQPLINPDDIRLLKLEKLVAKNLVSKPGQ